MDFAKIFGPVIEKALSEVKPLVMQGVDILKSIDKRLARIEIALNIPPLNNEGNIHDGNNGNSQNDNGNAH